MGVLDGTQDPGQGNPGDGAGHADLLGNKAAGESQKQEPKKEEAIAREWMKALPEPLRASKSLAKFADGTHIENLAKSYIELEGKLGRSIEVPGKDATDEERARYYTRIGRPSVPDDYDVTVSDTELAKRLRQTAFTTGMTREQLKAQSDAIAVYESEKEKLSAKTYTEAAAKADRALREEFGAQYESRMGYARRGYEALFSEGLRKELAKSGLSNSPEFIRVMSDLGTQIKEASLIKGTPSGSGDEDPYVKSMAYLKNT